MKKIILILMVFVAVSLQAQYEPCIQAGVITPKYKAMTKEEFKEACKKMTNKDRKYNTCFLDGTAPADSIWSRQARSEINKELNNLEIFNSSRMRRDLKGNEWKDFSRTIVFMGDYNSGHCMSKKEKEEELKEAKEKILHIKKEREEELRETKKKILQIKKEREEELRETKKREREIRENERERKEESKQRMLFGAAFFFAILIALFVYYIFFTKRELY